MFQFVKLTTPGEIGGTITVQFTVLELTFSGSAALGVSFRSVTVGLTVPPLARVTVSSFAVFHQALAFHVPVIPVAREDQQAAIVLAPHKSPSIPVSEAVPVSASIVDFCSPKSYKSTVQVGS